jgi:hypothetical protein
MTSRTRYFVIASLLVLTVGLGTGLVAYYVGVPGTFLVDRDGPAELQYVPRDTAIVAYAEVREIMTSDVHQKFRHAVPLRGDAQAQFQDQTGINIESDIDRVVASLQPLADGTTAGLVIARGRFDEVRIEALMREHGAHVEEYNGKRVIVNNEVPQQAGDTMALTFLEPGLVAVGSGRAVRAAIELQKGGENVTSNPELMNLMRSLDRGNAWAIGRIDALRTNGRLPPQIANQLPAITWFSVSSRIDSDISGTLRADARDDEAANNLRDVVRGFLALAKIQAGNRPELQTLVQSLQLSGIGKSVALSFSIPGAVLDSFGATRESAEKPPAH